MSVPQLTLPKYIGLKNDPHIDERWLHEQLIEHPELLGLGQLEVRDSERRQPSGGILDLLLEDVDIEPKRRYEVEIQLGEVDESHIIRTIEYWDIERRRYPQYEHIAVIVAEDITSRFLNVISLFNGTIPLMAIQLRGVEVDGAFTVIATRVVDVVILGTEEEGEAVDRSYWMSRSTPKTMQITDELLGMAREVYGKDHNVDLKYNKHYIGMTFGGRTNNVMRFRLRKPHILTEFKIAKDDRLTASLDKTELAVLPYTARFNGYRIQVRQRDCVEHRDVLLDLVKRVRKENP